jgi:hypothetical protein
MSARGSIVAAAVLACAALAAPAAAKPHHGGHHGPPMPVVYNVEYEGSGTYGVQQTATDGGGNTSATYSWDVHYSPLLIGPKGPVGTAAKAGSSTGHGTWSISSTHTEETCTQSGGLALAPFGGITGTRSKRGANLIVVPGGGDFKTVNATNGSGACDTSDFWQEWLESFSLAGIGDEAGTVDPLTSFAHLKNKEIKKHGKIVIETSNHTLAAPSLTIEPDCGSGGGSSCHQTFEWTGQVTLKKKKLRRH